MKNHLKFLSKSTNDLIVGNYMVLFGGRDLTGEFFTKKTQLESSYTDLGSMYVDFEHGVDPDGVGVGEDQVIGIVDWKSAKVDDTGVFVERILNRRAQYVDLLSNFIDAGLMGTSSEAVRGQVHKTRDGEITKWPLKRDSLTVTPAEPRMVTANLLQAAKSLQDYFPSAKSLANFVGDDSQKPTFSLEKIITLKDAEDYLREAGGLSKSQAVGFIARVKAASAARSDSAADLDALAAAIKRNTALMQGKAA
jgi:hypothetical protein